MAIINILSNILCKLYDFERDLFCVNVSGSKIATLKHGWNYRKCNYFRLIKSTCNIVDLFSFQQISFRDQKWCALCSLQCAPSCPFQSFQQRPQSQLVINQSKCYKAARKQFYYCCKIFNFKKNCLNC